MFSATELRVVGTTISGAGEEVGLGPGSVEMEREVDGSPA